MYVKEKYNVPLEKLELRTAYLLASESTTIEMNEQDLEEISDRINTSMDEMKQLLDDEYWNRPRILHILHHNHHQENVIIVTFGKYVKRV